MQAAPVAAVSAHEALLRAGLLVIPVDSNKQPVGAAEGEIRLCYQAPDSEDCRQNIRRIWNRVENSKELKKRWKGLALLAGANPHYPEKLLLIIDVDRPGALPPEARRLLSGGWHWLTGPRCPIDGEKHGIRCENGVCRHGDHEFKLADAPRGEAYAVLIPTEAAPLICGGNERRCRRKAMGGAVELFTTGYALIPPSLHPSGVLYEWVVGPLV